MAHAEPLESVQPIPVLKPQSDKRKFIVGGAFILAAIIYLIVSSTQANAQYYYTVDEITKNSSLVSGREIRVSGAVLGETINYDPNTLVLTFEVAHITGDNNEIEAQGGLAEVLHQATVDPARSRLKIIYDGPKPDLLKNEAQAIMTGNLDENGVFHAQELLLKCPSRYEEELPDQAGK